MNSQRVSDLTEAKVLFQGALPKIKLEVFDEPTIKSLQKAMELFEKWEAKKEMAETYEYWGAYQYNIQLYENAAPFIEKSLTIKIKLYGDSSKEIISNHLLLSYVYSQWGDLPLAEEYIEKAMKIATTLFAEPEELLAECYLCKSWLHTSRNEFKKALEYVYKTLEIAQNCPSITPFFEGQLYIDLGNCHIALGEFEEGEDFLNKAISIYEAILPLTHKEFGVIYKHLSAIYEETKEYDLAIKFLKKALIIFEYHHPNGLYSAWVHNSMQITYSTKQEYAKSIEAGKKADVILKETGMEEMGFSTVVYKYLSQAYARLNAFPKSINYLLKAIKVSKKVYGEISIPMVSMNYSLGVYHFHKQEYEQSKKAFLESLRLSKQLSNIPVVHLTQAYVGIAKASAYAPKPDFLRALQSVHKAISLNLNGYKDEDIYSFPFNKIQETPSLTGNIDLLAMQIRLKASIFFKYYMEESREMKDLETSFKGFEIASNTAKYILQSFQSDSSKLGFIKITHTDLLKEFGTSYVFYEITQNKFYLQNAFDITEKNKAYLMLQSNQEKAAKRQSNLPNELIQQESKLKKRLTIIQKNIQNQEQRGEKKGAKLVQEYRDKYLKNHIKFKNLQKQLKKEYPEYYRLKYSTSTVSIEALQPILEENQTVLSYFIGEDKIYLFTITADEFEVFIQDKPEGWKALVKNYLQSIKFHQKSEFVKYSFELYQLLLQEVMHHIIDSFADETKQIFIIPDAELHYLPFETLLIQQTSDLKSYSEMDYLLNHCKISYHYSVTLLHLELQKQHSASAERAPTELSFTGFAPVYTSTSDTQQEALKTLQIEQAVAVNRSEIMRSDGTLIPLPHSKIEVESISKLFTEEGHNSQSFLHQTANKKNLIQHITNSHFVLIAAHGIVNHEYPELSGLVLATDESKNFSSKNKPQTTLSDAERTESNNSISDCILNMKEVAMMPIKAGLVVLSSCESSIGELHQGEGMMAVNRGFMESGAKNVISTLFKVNDQASSELTQILFGHILKGDDFATALQKAKLELLQKEGMNPKSWSGFILFGTGKGV